MIIYNRSPLIYVAGNNILMISDTYLLPKKKKKKEKNNKQKNNKKQNKQTNKPKNIDIFDIYII